MNEQKDSPASEGIPERIWVDKYGYYPTPAETSPPNNGIEFIRVSSDSPSVKQAASKIVLLIQDEYEHGAASIENQIAEIISTELASDSKEPSVQTALEELREMFPETTVHVSWHFLPKLYRVNVPWHDLECSGRTLIEAMAKVREWKEQQK